MNRVSDLSVTSSLKKSNQVVSELSLNDRRQFLRLGETVDLSIWTVLCEPDTPLASVYFPLTCIISLSAISRDHQPLGMSVIGSEGMLGSTLALGAQTTGMRAVVHGSGQALCLTSTQLLGLLDSSPELATVLRGEAYKLLGRFVRTAVCNSFHDVEMRLARWLLMTDDCSSSPQFELTHKFLAELLGVRRSAVTIAAGSLQNKKLIRYSRGQINILSRKGLEAASCECYAASINN